MDNLQYNVRILNIYSEHSVTDDKNVFVRFKDTGPGIHYRDRERIF